MTGGRGLAPRTGPVGAVAHGSAANRTGGGARIPSAQLHRCLPKPVAACALLRADPHRPRPLAGSRA